LADHPVPHSAEASDKLASTIFFLAAAGSIAFVTAIFIFVLL
jgi:hypothetical protein